MACVMGYLILVPAWMLGSEWLGHHFFNNANGTGLVHLLQRSAILFISAGVVGWILQRQFRMIVKTNRVLSNREKHFRNLYESAPVAYQSLDEEGLILEINRAWLQMLGYAEAEVVGQPFEKFLRPAQHPVFRNIHQALQRNNSLEEVEFNLVRKDGTDITVSIHARVVVEHGTGARQTQGILLNITESKRQTGEIERLNRLYAALSQINQTVVRAKSDQEVFEKVCHAAFTYGGFKMVWFGKLHTPTGIVHPVAHSCGSANDLKQFCLSTLHGLELSGPIATSVRNGKPEICNTMTEKTASPFWRQLAAGHGVGSVAVFPVRVDQEIRGIFVFLALESDFFQKREVLLLEEAAVDVAFALTVLEQDLRRRSAETALRQRQAKLDSLFRAVPAGIGVVVNGQIVEANQAFYNLTGFTAEELIGNPIRLLYPTQEEFDVVEQEIMLGGPISTEHRWQRKDGTEIDVLVQASWIVPDDFSKGVTFVALNITERITAEAKLRHSLQQLEESRRIANLGTYDLDLATGSWSASEILDEIFGIKSMGAYKQSVAGWLEIVHPEDREQMRNHFENHVLRRQSFFDREYRIIRPCDQQVRWVHGLGKLIFNSEGQMTRMTGTIQDITRQKRIEEALCEQESRLSSIFRALPSGVGVARGRLFTEVNLRICEMSGYAMEELLGQSTRMLYESDADFEKAGRSLYGMRNIGTAECRWKRKNGEGFDVLICSSQLTPNDPSAITFTVTDITEKKRMEERILRSQRIESIGTLASGVAHDLNNILAPIMLSIDLLRQGERTEQDADMLQMLADGTQRGAGIVKQLLLYGRGVEGKRAHLQLRSLLKEMTKVITQTFPKSIVLEQRIDTDLWPIHADATQIHQVLLNLCVNARDAMPRGGRLLLQAENVILDELYAQANPEAKAGPYVVLSVCDTGEGIRPEILSKIFDPFFTTKEQGKGTGLGLSTVLGILKSHYGFVQTSSRLGEGSTFKIYLPASLQNEHQNQRQIEMPRLPQGDGELILIVDDEESIRSVAKRILEQNGYRAITASNGADGLVAYLQNRDAQVVITDMVMPVMDGPTFLRVLTSYAPDIRAITMSGLAAAIDYADHDRASIPADISLRKPFTSEELLMILNHTLHNKDTMADDHNQIQSAKGSKHIESAFP